MSERGKGKPNEASKRFTIWGAGYHDGEVLNDPTRPRRSKEAEAHKAHLEYDLKRRLERRFQEIARPFPDGEDEYA